MFGLPILVGVLGSVLSTPRCNSVAKDPWIDLREETAPVIEAIETADKAIYEALPGFARDCVDAFNKLAMGR